MAKKEPNIPGHRTQEQILESARKIDALRNSGIDPDDIYCLLEARNVWWGHREWPPTVSLQQLLLIPEVKEFDEMLWAAIRRHVRTRKH